MDYTYTRMYLESFKNLHNKLEIAFGNQIKHCPSHQNPFSK